MKIFSKILENKIGDLPEDYEYLMDLFTLYKESYSGKVKSVEISKGYLTDKKLSSMVTTNACTFFGAKKMRELFPNGLVPDKFHFCASILIEFEGLTDILNIPRRDSYDYDKGMFGIDSVDIILSRYKSIKTLAQRCKEYCSDVKISYGVGSSGNKIGLLVIF